MTTTAPGQAGHEQEPDCYNCGVKGHWAFACPEPTKAVPVGLQRWKEHGNSERVAASRDKKGPAVTRYPPPPPAQAAPPLPYGAPPPPPPLPPGVPPPPPPPAQAQAYSHPSYPPNAYPGSYQPAHPAPQFGHYAAPPPAPAQYAQQTPYGQPQYSAPGLPPSGYYPPAPPPPPSTYPTQQFGPPPPPSPAPYPSAYATPTPPPPGVYQYPPGQQAYGPPPATGPHYGPPPPPPPPGAWLPHPAGPPPTPPSANQTPLGTHRGKHQKNHGSKRAQNHRDKNRHGRERRGKNDPRNDRHGRRPSRDGQSRAEAPQEKDKEPREKKEERSEPAEDAEQKSDSGWDAQLEEEFRVAFPDPDDKPADPVGIPLTNEYNDNPTIPPAYNATCVKSEYFREDSQEDFVRSIREHASWATLQKDPAFKHYPGMAIRRFTESKHDYPTYDRSDPPPSPSVIKMPPRFKIDRSVLRQAPNQRPGMHDQRTGYAEQYPLENHRRRDQSRDRYNGHSEDRRSRKRSLDASPEYDRDDRDTKRSRWSGSRRDRSRENYGRVMSPRRRSPSPPGFNLEGDPWSPQAGESNYNTSSNRRHADAYNDPKFSPSREERVSYADKRHDSGYHSGQSLDRGTPRYREERGRRPSDRSYRKRRTPSRSRSRRPGPSRGRSRGRSRASTSDRTGRSRSRSRSESPLTHFERELLGLIGSESSEAEPEPAPKPVVKKPIRRVKVAAAFGRRW